MKVVPLFEKPRADDIAAGLRVIADDIEKGEYRFDPTLAVVILGAESNHRDQEGTRIDLDWKTHGLGEQSKSVFASRGLIAAALRCFEGPGADE